MPSELSIFVLRLMGCLAQTIQFMHSKDVQHQDIKPNNLLLRSGHIYVNDFGISHDSSFDVYNTTELQLGHTRGFAPPEVTNGDAHNPHQVDVYSLGCTYLHMIITIYGGAREACETITGGGRRGEARNSVNGVKEYLDQLKVSSDKSAFDSMLSRLTSSTKAKQLPVLDPKPSMELHRLINDMLKRDRHEWPAIDEVNRRLWDMGGEEHFYHHECCAKAMFDKIILGGRRKSEKSAPIRVELGRVQNGIGIEAEANESTEEEPSRSGKSDGAKSSRWSRFEAE